MPHIVATHRHIQEVFFPLKCVSCEKNMQRGEYYYQMSDFTSKHVSCSQEKVEQKIKESIVTRKSMSLSQCQKRLKEIEKQLDQKDIHIRSQEVLLDQQEFTIKLYQKWFKDRDMTLYEL